MTESVCGAKFSETSAPCIVKAKPKNGHLAVATDVLGNLQARVFTAQQYASMVLAVIVCPSIRLSVCLSVRHVPVLYQTEAFLQPLN